MRTRYYGDSFNLHRGYLRTDSVELICLRPLINSARSCNVPVHKTYVGWK